MKLEITKVFHIRMKEHSILFNNKKGGAIHESHYYIGYT